MALYFLYCFDCRASLKPLELLPTTIYTFPLPGFSLKSIKPTPAPTSFSMHPTAFVEMAVRQVNKKWLLIFLVINHQPYDQKVDVFSFAIVLWELVTAKVPYDTMTPLQAALGVRQGLRPDLPKNAHPKLLELMQRCWEAVPDNRPCFSVITSELETLLQEVQITSEVVNGT